MEAVWPLTRWCVRTSLHGVTSHKNTIDVFTAVRTSDLKARSFVTISVLVTSSESRQYAENCVKMIRSNTEACLYLKLLPVLKVSREARRKVFNEIEFKTETDKLCSNIY